MVASIPKKMEWKGIGLSKAFYRGGIYPSALNNKGAVEMGFISIPILGSASRTSKYLNATTISI